jgi:hypothetical protein
LATSIHVAANCENEAADQHGSWEECQMPLAEGSVLPMLPLWLDTDLVLPLDLERSYEATFVEMRVPV